jgi:FkbM family methyltransferase
VGANKGQSIQFFLKLFPGAVIYAFEPNPRLFKMLQKKYHGKKNIKLFNKGISSENGKLVLHETITDETSTFEELNYDSGYLKRKAKILGVKPDEVIHNRYEVDVITLNDFIAETGIQKIDIVKIDTEGHEHKCLEGLFNGNKIDIDYIQLEQHYDDMYLHAGNVSSITGLLQQNHFNATANIKHGFGSFEEIIFKQQQ